METKTASPLSKLCKVTALLALFLLPALGPSQASAASCPFGCAYKLDPATGCCEPDPRFDCPSICF